MSQEDLALVTRCLQEDPMVIEGKTAEAFLRAAEAAPDDLRAALSAAEDQAWGCLARVARRLWEETTDVAPLHVFMAEAAGCDVVNIQVWELQQHLRDLQVLMEANAMNNLCRALESFIPAGETREFGAESTEKLHSYFENCALLREPSEDMQQAMMRFALLYDRIELPQAEHELILSRLIGFAVRRGDTNALDACLNMVPDPVTKPGLAFNLACHAAKSANQSDLLRWTATALELGQPARSFQDDADFESVRGSPEFEALFK